MAGKQNQSECMEGDAGSADRQAVEHRDVRKAVETIAVNPRSGKLTLLTRKLFNVLLFHAQKQGLERPTYRLALSEICSTALFDSNDTALVKEHLRKMNACQVEWSSSSKTGKRWNIGNLIASATISEEGGPRATIVEWSYAPNVKERILKPDVYTRISLQFQSALRSSAALALFEVCTRYATSPGGLTMREAWEWWRPRLTGVPDGQDESHAEYKYFKRDVLKPSITEVNQVTDLAIEMIEHKNGRKVIDLQFRVARKQQATLDLQDSNLFDMALLSRIMAFGIFQKEAENIYANYEENFVRATVELTEKRIAQKNVEPLLSQGAYFKQALRQKWAGKPEAALAQKKLVTAVAKKPKMSKEDLLDKLNTHRRTEAEGYYNEMAGDEKVAFQSQFEAEALPSLGVQVASAWRKTGMKSKLASTSFFSWLAISTWGEPTETDLLEFMLALQT